MKTSWSINDSGTRELSRYGFWSAQHEARTDMVMLLSLIFLSVVGSGGWSLDRWLAQRRQSAAPPLDRAR